VWLTDAWIHGFRRFGGETRHRVRFDAKLVCLIGANEAGKSTVLDALEFAQEGGEFQLADRTRGEALPSDRRVVELRFRLDDADRAAVSTVPRDPGGPQEVRWFTVARTASGERLAYAEPELVRDRARRGAMRSVLAERSTTWWPVEPVGDGENDEAAAEEAPAFAPDRGRVDGVVETLARDDSTLPETLPDDLRALAGEVEPRDGGLAAELRELADLEAADPPDVRADELLWNRMPRFVRFDDRARLLESEYNLDGADTSAGTAFANFVRLAQLDVTAFRTAIANGETGTARDLRERANRTLSTRMEAWQQDPPITVALEHQGVVLQIHVKSGEGPTMAFRERSDGLRQFVALVALTAHQPNPTPPILLIDEVETHLHYNAQADLIEVLATQTAAGQVVYTTHSAACLPEDLGLGVRVVEGLGAQTASTVRQAFWQDEHPGLGSLLMAMGASSLMYVTLRPAVIAEGGSDLILLPSLLREATSLDALGFALIPGAATAPPEAIAGLGLQGVRTVWVLDADEGGRARTSGRADRVGARRGRGRPRSDFRVCGPCGCATRTRAAALGGTSCLTTAGYRRSASCCSLTTRTSRWRT
jgi:energy-coupling factor transporter ATP-binding protein EcfA2